MFLAIADTLTATQQQKIVKTLHALAKLRDEQGDVLIGNWCHALAGDKYVEPPPANKPKLYIVK
jgi:hypothetical protein